MAVMVVTPEGIMVSELHPDYTKEEVQAATGVELIWPDEVKPYDED
jgi:acetate CoA/acetoacetate CoA-transferase beta subunit